jgi:hypothetical protein
MGEKQVFTYAPFSIEKGKIKEFAKAIGLNDPIYFDRNKAIEKGFRDIPAPPTFPTVIDYCNDRDIYQFFEEANINQEATLHGEQSYKYLKDICANDTIQAYLTIKEKIQKRDKTFYYLKTEYFNQYDELVLISQSTLIVVGEETGE